MLNSFQKLKFSFVGFTLMFFIFHTEAYSQISTNEKLIPIIKFVLSEQDNGTGECPEVTDETTLERSRIDIFNQSDLDNLAGVTRITGSLVIRSTRGPIIPIQDPSTVEFDFSPLDSLVEVGSLSTGIIRKNVSGFNCLKTIRSGLSIGSSVNTPFGSLIENVSGFNSLTTIGGRLQIQAPSLKTIPDFSSLISIGGFSLINSGLTDIPGFPLLEVISDPILVRDNSSLMSISGFESLKKIGTAPRVINRISNNDSLVDLSGFSSLQALELETDPRKGSLEFSDNDSLIDISGFNELKNISKLDIENNDNLINISGFGMLDSTDLIRVLNNNSLRVISWFQGLINGGSLKVDGNANLIEISGFPQAETFNFFISNNPKFGLLEGFGSFSDGTFSIVNNGGFTSITGFPLISQRKAIVRGAMISDDVVINVPCDFDIFGPTGPLGPRHFCS